MEGVTRLCSCVLIYLSHLGGILSYVICKLGIGGSRQSLIGIPLPPYPHRHTLREVFVWVFSRLSTSLRYILRNLEYAHFPTTHIGVVKNSAVYVFLASHRYMCRDSGAFEHVFCEVFTFIYVAIRTLRSLVDEESAD